MDMNVNTEISKKQTVPDLAAPNPFFKRIERAPYELGYLLLELPRHGFQVKSKDARQKAEAARSHANNAKYTLLNGLEALGSFMFVAGANEENEINDNALSSLGCLIQHIAVELQFLDEMVDHFGEVKGGAE